VRKSIPKNLKTPRFPPEDLGFNMSPFIPDMDLSGEGPRIRITRMMEQILEPGLVGSNQSGLRDRISRRDPRTLSRYPEWMREETQWHGRLHIMYTTAIWRLDSNLCCEF